MKKQFLSDLENSLFQSGRILKVCIGVTKKRFLSDLECSFYRAPKRRKLLVSCFGSMKRRFVSDSENSVFQGWQNGNRFMFFSAPTKRYVSDSENSIFQDAKTLEVPSMSFWCHEKVISFGFGKFASSERHNIQYSLYVAMEQRKTDFFRIRNILFSRPPKSYKSRQTCFGAPKKRFFFGLAKFAFSGRQNAKNASRLFGAPKNSFLSDS